MDVDQPLALTVRRFCELHAIGRTTFYEEVKSGRLKIRKLGKKTLILREDADRWRAALPANVHRGAMRPGESSRQQTNYLVRRTQ